MVEVSGNFRSCFGELRSLLRTEIKKGLNSSEPRLRQIVTLCNLHPCKQIRVVVFFADSIKDFVAKKKQTDSEFNLLRDELKNFIDDSPVASRINYLTQQLRDERQNFIWGLIIESMTLTQALVPAKAVLRATVADEITLNAMRRDPNK